MLERVFGIFLPARQNGSSFAHFHLFRSGKAGCAPSNCGNARNSNSITPGKKIIKTTYLTHYQQFDLCAMHIKAEAKMPPKAHPLWPVFRYPAISAFLLLVVR